MSLKLTSRITHPAPPPPPQFVKRQVKIAEFKNSSDTIKFPPRKHTQATPSATLSEPEIEKVKLFTQS